MRRFSILLSAAIHALLLLLVLGALTLRRPRPLAPPAVVGTWIELERGESKGSPVASKSGSRKSPGHPSVALKDLGISLFGNAKKPGTSDGSLAEGARGAVGDRFGDAGKEAWLRKVSARVEESFTYPAEFQAAGFEGTVSGQLALGEGDCFLEDASTFKSASDYLRVHVHRVLRQSLKRCEGAAASSKPRWVAVRFAFESGEYEPKSEPPHAMDGGLFFRRWVRKSALSWQLGPLAGWGPFAGMDVLWFVRTAAEGLSRKAKIDPLEIYRNDPAW